MLRLIATVTVGATLVLAACGGDEGEAPAPPSDAKTGGSAIADRSSSNQGQRSNAERSRDGESPGITIEAGDSQFGQVLFDGSQQAIYVFDLETSEEPKCYGACAEAWPPVLAKGDPIAGDGAESRLLETTVRTDGSTQVTYDGHPLYYYAHDPRGKVLCHNVEEFGGLWLAVKPGGAAVQ